MTSPSPLDLSASQLLPCPFCGGDPVLEPYGPRCLNRDCTVQPYSSYRTQAEAIAAWNRRASPLDSSIAPLAPLKEEMQKSFNADLTVSEAGQVQEDALLACPRCEGAGELPNWSSSAGMRSCPLCTKPPPTDAAFVRDLLWNEHPECCGNPVVGATHMGEQEQLCCGCPEPAMLNDAQIVATLRARFPSACRCGNPNAEGVVHRADGPCFHDDTLVELAELREANRMTPDHLALAKFYGVTTYAGLVQAQAHHVEKLQAKLPATPNVFAPQRVREG